jgi:hypothetical protein
MFSQLEVFSNSRRAGVTSRRPSDPPLAGKTDQFPYTFRTLRTPK